MVNYPLQLWWFVLSLIGVCTLLHGGSLVRRYWRLRRARLALLAGESQKEGEPEQEGRQDASSWRHLSASISTVWKVVLYRSTLPISWDYQKRMSVAELLFCGGYLLACLTWAFVLSTTGNGPVDFANRNAWIALWQTPLVVGLAGKNNIASFLTGVGPEKLNILHRAAGRTLLILACAHAFGRYQIGLSGPHAIYQPIMIWGVVALTSFALTTVLGIRWFRAQHYELFLCSHIVLVFLFLLGAYLHQPPYYYQWIYPSFALWAADRLARLFHLLIFNPWLPRSCRAHVQALSDCTLRVTLQRRMRWRAGQHAYLLLPFVSRLPWEAHPFTVASLRSPSASGAGGGGGNELVFLVRARDGFTRRLMARALKEGGECDVTALVDGAYGAPPRLEEYQTVVLIAGGSGVSYCLPLLASVVAGKGLTKKVLFAWVVRRETHLGWIADELAAIVRAVPAGLQVEIRLYVTNSGKPSPTRMGSFTTIESASLAGAIPDAEAAATDMHGVAALVRLPQVTLAEGRPEVHGLIKQAVEGASGPVSVGVCGPSGLSNAVTTVLTTKDVISWGNALRGAPVVDLHVETFGW
ncbi:hypothetical protein CALVIDRAFT_512747 [Calocera viscosa TUFC12733]|uniref:FAD-binding FR-type domain-containing protein n=1 Tax=Calocera viscosa (strain TUFC12733) TaxID=1330018 RepID=A0A167NVZ3_CALVF|nr:hypothetical protein CALVIDRAFT_512747 [Calocera viscosa TUFC12733]